MISSFGSYLVTTLLSLRKTHIYARARLIRSAVLVALVMIPLILALIFMDGMMRGITDKYITLQDGHAQLYVREPLHDYPQEFTRYDQRIISGDFVVSGYGIIYSREATAEVRIKGVDTSYFSAVRTAQLSLSGNPVEKENRLPVITLSEALADQLGVSVGDRVACMVVPDSSTAVVRPILAEVTSLYHSGYHELDTSLVFMNRSDALRFFPQEKNGYTELLIDPAAVDYLDEIIEKIQEVEEQQIPYATWDSFNTTVYTNFITSRQVILLVFIMILLVAGVYVASIAQELVQDSMQSIALFKTMGARNSTLYRAYFITVMTVTLFGMILGTAMGVFLALRLGSLLEWLSTTGLAGLQYYLLDFPMVVSIPDILFICTAMLVISSVTVHLSLRRIRKISPLQLLQQD